MTELLYESVFKSLDKHKVRYLLVGGMAVNFYGFVRATQDLDLILDFEKENLLRFESVMKELNWRPRVPVFIADLADPGKRKQWQREKGAIVLQLDNSSKPMEHIDVFIEHPFDFEKAYEKRRIIRLNNTEISVVGIDDLILLKRKAGRPADLMDISVLERVKYRFEKE